MEDLAFDISSIEDPTSPTPFTTSFNKVEQFCTPESLSASTNYINLLLTSYGYPVPLVFNSTEAQNDCKIVNCVYAILNDKKNEEQEREQLNSTIDKITAETKDLQEQLNQVKRDLQQKDKEYREAKSKLEANELNHKQRATENNRLKEEVAKLKNNIQYVKSQYAHETKRHNQELTKTKDHLIKLMNNHYRVNVAQLNMNSYFETTENSAADEDQVIQMRKMYDDVLTKSNEKERQERRETEELRSALIVLYTSARRLLETQIERFEQIKLTNRNAHNETARFRLPMDCGGKEALEYIEMLITRIKEEWDSQIKDQPPEYKVEERAAHLHHISLLETTLDELSAKIEKTQEEYEEKLSMYKKFEQGGFFDTLYPTPQAAYIPPDSPEDDPINESEVRNFQEFKKQVMKDRQKLSEGFIKLGIERVELEAERSAFKEYTRKHRLEEILTNYPDEQVPIQPTKPVNSKEIERPRKKIRSFLGAPSMH